MIVIDVATNQIRRRQEVLIQFEPGTSAHEVALYARALRKWDEDTAEDCHVLPHANCADVISECFSVGVECS
jgi:hypothetical protein